MEAFFVGISILLVAMIFLKSFSVGVIGVEEVTRVLGRDPETEFTKNKEENNLKFYAFASVEENSASAIGLNQKQVKKYIGNDSSQLEIVYTTADQPTEDQEKKIGKVEFGDYLVAFVYHYNQLVLQARENRNNA